MGFDFKDISITAFDIHPAPLPLINHASGYFQSGFDFLADEEKYNRTYKISKGIRTKHFQILPFSKNERETHFWKDYLQEDPKTKNTNSWQMHLPFKCVPIKSSIRLALDIKDAEARIRPSIYLSNLGWSTNIAVSLRGDLKNQQIIALINQIADKTSARKPFLIDNEAVNLPEALMFFQKLLLQDVYRTEQPPHPGMKITRQILISLNRYDPANPSAPVIYDEMAQDDQALLRSILYGKQIDAIKILEEKRNRPLLLTVVSQPCNFALTDFDYGSLFFLQSDAGKDEREAAVHCHDRNVKNCLMMALMLADFYRMSETVSASSPLTQLRNQVKTNLYNLPKRYRNQFCQNLFLKNASLNSFQM